MVTIFFILVALAVFHFIYEGILAPSYKFTARLKLFRLRDELRLIKIENPETLTDELFSEIQETLNRQIHYFDRFNVVNVIRAYKSIKGDAELDQRVWIFNEWLKDCPIPEVREIHTKSMALFWETVAINNGGLIAISLPIFVIVTILDLLGRLAAKLSIYFIAKYRKAVHIKFARQATRILETSDVVFSRKFNTAY
jgi:hypothetical protein